MAQNDRTAVVSETHSRSPQQPTNERADEMTFAPGFDPLARLAASAPGGPDASIHASALNRLTGSEPSRAWPSLLQLQRQHGNRYVQRVLALAKQGEGSADIPPTPKDSMERVSGGEPGRPADYLGSRDANGVAEGADTVVDRAASSTGEPLPDVVRGRFERSLGADLSGVRVHAGAESAKAARAVGAQAYTVGQDIHFGAAKYAPSDPAGLHLLAHEVAHTVQGHGAATMRQRKLDVSSSADPAELEAERSADAMVLDSSFGIDNTVSAIHRQDTPVPQTTPVTTPAPDTPPASAPAQTPGTTPPGTPTATPASPAPASTTVQLFWLVDWARTETSSAVTSKSNARTGKESASGTLKAMPTGSTGPNSNPSWSIIPWLNAAPSGPVLIGTVSHPKDVGGTVSTDVSYGAPPSGKADVAIDPDFSANLDKDALKALQNGLKDKKKAASDVVSRQLKLDLMSMGTVEMIEADLNKAVSAAVGEGYKATVKVTQTPGANAKVPPLTAPYDPLSADGKRIVNITVPTKVQELKGTKAASTTVVDSAKVVEKTGHNETTVTDVRTDVTTSMLQSFKDAYTDMTSKATHDATSLSGSGKITLGGSASAGGSFKDLDINLGALLALLTIEDPALALALKTAVGSMKVSGEGNATLGGDLTLKGDASKQWSDDEVRNTLKQHKAEMENKIETNFKSVIQKTVNDTYSREATGEHGVTQTGASSSETIQVDYIVSDQPTLTVTSEAAGPASK